MVCFARIGLAKHLDYTQIPSAGSERYGLIASVVPVEHILEELSGASFQLRMVAVNEALRLDNKRAVHTRLLRQGRKTILKSTELKPAASPSPDFKFPSDKGKSRSPRIKVGSLARPPQ
jgi:hypothetical protein